jgi:hypothetical protein
VNRSAEQLVINLDIQKEYAKLNRLAEEALNANTPDYSFMLPHVDKIAFAYYGERPSYNQAINYKYNDMQIMKDQIQSEKALAEFKNYPPLKAILNQ